MCEFLTIRETAKKYGLSESMLRQMEACGKLPGIYTGATQRVKRVNTALLFEQLDAESRACGKIIHESRSTAEGASEDGRN